jgi:signal transduction histidine kinase
LANHGENWIESHLGAIAHDLRGPLSVVSGHAQVLRRLADGGSAEKVRASAEAIMRASTRIAGVLDQLCTTGHDKGVAAATGEKVAVDELLDGALRGSRARQVTLDVAADLPPVMVDRQSLEHRLAVLLAALRIGRGDEPITVRVERHGSAVRITLPDAWLELPVA